MGNSLHIYTRVSTDQQEKDGHSLDYQRDMGIKKAQDLEMSYKLHNEGSKSGASPDIDERPVLSNLMSMVRDGNVKHIFVYEFSRLSRDPILSSLLSEDLKKYGVTIHLQGGKYDLSTPIDEMVSSILNSVSRYERQTILNRSRLGLRKAYEKGKMTGQIPPLGYKRNEDGYMVIDEEEKKIYEQIVAWTLQGESPFEIARRLNDMNVPTKYQKHRKKGVRLTNKETGETRLKQQNQFYWKGQTVDAILKNPVYYGYRRYKDGLVPHNYPIIDKETWDSIQEAIKKRVKTAIQHQGGKRKYFYLLKGLLRCAKCGSNLSGRIKEDERTYYCAKKRREMRDNRDDPPCGLRSPNLDMLNELVWDKLLDILENSHLRREEFKQALLQGRDSEQRIEQLEKEISRETREISEIENQAKRLLRLFTTGKIDEEIFEDEDSILKKKRGDLIKSRESKTTQIELAGDMTKWVDWYAQYFEAIDSLRELEDGKEKQDMIRTIVDEIVVDSEGREHIVKISLKFPLIDDKFRWIDPYDKSKGYKLRRGRRIITVKKSPIDPTLNNHILGDSVVGRPERPGGDQRLVRGQNAGDRVDAGGGQRLFEGKVGKDGGDTPGEHGLAGARRTDHRQIVPPGGGHFDSALAVLLAAHVDKVNLVGGVLLEDRGDVQIKRLQAVAPFEEFDRLLESGDAVDERTTGDGRFAGVLIGDDHAVGAVLVHAQSHGQHALDGSQTAGEGEFTEEDEVRDTGWFELFGGDQDADGDRQIKG
jgi:site-specific DNA recombinase